MKLKLEDLARKIDIFMNRLTKLLQKEKAQLKAKSLLKIITLFKLLIQTLWLENQKLMQLKQLKMQLLLMKLKNHNHLTMEKKVQLACQKKFRMVRIKIQLHKEV